jgi:hypothetical protein
MAFDYTYLNLDENLNPLPETPPRGTPANPLTNIDMDAMFEDGGLFASKINNVNASQIKTGQIQVDQQILVSDGIDIIGVIGKIVTE